MHLVYDLVPQGVLSGPLRIKPLPLHTEMKMTTLYAYMTSACTAGGRRRDLPKPSERPGEPEAVSISSAHPTTFSVRLRLTTSYSPRPKPEQHAQNMLRARPPV